MLKKYVLMLECMKSTSWRQQVRHDFQQIHVHRNFNMYGKKVCLDVKDMKNVSHRQKEKQNVRYDVIK